MTASDYIADINLLVDQYYKGFITYLELLTQVNQTTVSAKMQWLLND